MHIAVEAFACQAERIPQADAQAASPSWCCTQAFSCTAARDPVRACAASPVCNCLQASFCSA